MILKCALRRYRILPTVFILSFISFAVFEFQLVPSWIPEDPTTQQSLTHQTSPKSHGEKPHDPSNTTISLTSAILPTLLTVSSFPVSADALPFPPEYQQAPAELAYCDERFGLKYLQTLS